MGNTAAHIPAIKLIKVRYIWTCPACKTENTERMFGKRYRTICTACGLRVELGIIKEEKYT